MEPVYYGHLGTNKKCPDYQGVLIFQFSLYKTPFGPTAKCDAGVLIFKCPDLINRFHCIENDQCNLYKVKSVDLLTC